MSIPAAWPRVLDFFGAPPVSERSPGRRPVTPDCSPPASWTRASGSRAFAEAVDGPRATGLTEHSRSERARARVVGILAGCQDRDGHGNRLDSGAAHRSGQGGKEQE